MPRPRRQPNPRRPDGTADRMAREADKRVDVTEAGSGRLLVRGELTFATARLAREIGVRVLDAQRAERIVVDCAAVTRADSAGLAVLLDWLAWGRRHNRAVTLENLPASLVAIA